MALQQQIQLLKSRRFCNQQSGGKSYTFFQSSFAVKKQTKGIIRLAMDCKGHGNNASLKRNNVSRSLAFVPKVTEEATAEQENDCKGHNNKILKISSKQVYAFLDLIWTFMPTWNRRDIICSIHVD